jgi:pimeloyl-ACP methyl ester carboxylesterase
MVLGHVDPDLLDSWWRAIRNPTMRLVFFEPELQRLDLLRQLDRIKCPTLIVAGENDPITPVADMEEIAAALRPDLVRLERFANAGHGVYRDRPGAFFPRVARFYRGLGLSRGTQLRSVHAISLLPLALQFFCEGGGE